MSILSNSCSGEYHVKKNFNEEKAVITFTAEELEGVPADVVSGYTKRTDESGKEVFDVTYKTPDIFPIVRSIRSMLRCRELMTAPCISSNLHKTRKLGGALSKDMKIVYRSIHPFWIGSLNFAARLLHCLGMTRGLTIARK